MEAIILAGGFGTRLQPIVKDVPKPMADVNGRPFLSYLTDYLIVQGVGKVLLSVGYKYEIIKSYFGFKYKSIDIEYVIENEPLGTGGAIREALKSVKGEEAIILNGDTFFNLDLKKMVNFHSAHNSMVTIAVKPMCNFDRYGTVILKGDRIIGFKEKSFKDSGFVNGGVYVVNKGIFDSFKQHNNFSFEVDFLQKNADKSNLNAFLSDSYFIDMGIPEDYAKAQKELGEIFKGIIK